MYGSVFAGLKYFDVTVTAAGSLMTIFGPDVAQSVHRLLMSGIIVSTEQFYDALVLAACSLRICLGPADV